MTGMPSLRRAGPGDPLPYVQGLLRLHCKRVARTDLPALTLGSGRGELGFWGHNAWISPVPRTSSSAAPKELQPETSPRQQRAGSPREGISPPAPSPSHFCAVPAVPLQQGLWDGTQVMSGAPCSAGSWPRAEPEAQGSWAHAAARALLSERQRGW